MIYKQNCPDQYSSLLGTRYFDFVALYPQEFKISKNYTPVPGSSGGSYFPGNNKCVQCLFHVVYVLSRVSLLVYYMYLLFFSTVRPVMHDEGLARPNFLIRLGPMPLTRFYSTQVDGPNAGKKISRM